jgi:hypothetical protein
MFLLAVAATVSQIDSLTLSFTYTSQFIIHSDAKVRLYKLFSCKTDVKPLIPTDEVLNTDCSKQTMQEALLLFF